MPDPCTAYERAAYITYLLCQGGAYTAAEVAYRTGLQVRQAQYLLLDISRMVPIYRETDGKWQLLTDKTH